LLAAASQAIALEQLEALLDQIPGVVPHADAIGNRRSSRCHGLLWKTRIF